MKLPRRKFLHLTAGAAALPAFSRIADAQTYPTRPVRIVVGFAPGAATDSVARLMGQWLSERLGQTVVVENRPGAGASLATEVVVRAPADGHSLLLVSTTAAINATLYPKLSYNFLRDIVPVASVNRDSSVFAVHPSFPAKTLPEFIAYAKRNPGKITMASPGAGTLAHLSGELFKATAGIDIVHVPYRGGQPMLTDALSGQVQSMVTLVAAAAEHIRAGRLRALAVSTATRSQALPDVPAMAETLPGYEASAWTGIGAPKGTPAEIVERLNQQINAGLADAKLKAGIANLGGEVFMTGSAADFRKFIAEETDKWSKVIKLAGIKPE